MPPYPFFHAFPDLAATCPGKVLPFKQLAELVIIHENFFRGIVVRFQDLGRMILILRMPSN